MWKTTDTTVKKSRKIIPHRFKSSDILELSVKDTTGCLPGREMKYELTNVKVYLSSVTLY